MSSEIRNLFEAATLVGEKANEDGTWKVRLISEGKGSSGFYTSELLENHHSAFDNVLSFKNHPTGWDGPSERDFTMIVGEIKGETWVEKDDRGLTAVYGNYLPDPEYRDKIERYKEKLGVSIYIEGSGYVNESGEYIVDWFNPADPYASLDIVIAAGARGKFEESMKQAYAHRRAENASTASVVENQDEEGLSKMAEKDVLDALAKLTVAVEAMTESKQEQVRAEADSAAVATEAAKRVETYDAAISVIEAADILPSQKQALRESAKRGEDIAPAVESAKAIAAEAREAFASQGEGETGRLGESAATATKFGAWS